MKSKSFSVGSASAVMGQAIGLLAVVWLTATATWAEEDDPQLFRFEAGPGNRNWHANVNIRVFSFFLCP